MHNQSNKQYKIGIALSGGGARGFAHAGALKALEEFGIRPDILAGVSAGSIVASLYASGMSPDKITPLFSGLKFNDLCEPCIPKNGFFKLDKLKRFLSKHIVVNDIQDLQIPTIICATNLDYSTPIAFTVGNIAERVVASCSVPIVFNPVKIDGVYYVDGGVTNNLPAWALRDKCEFLIGINCSPLMQENFNYTLIETAQRSFELMACGNASKDMPLCDIVIETTNIATHKVFNLKDSMSVYKCGYDSTMNILVNNRELINKIIQND